MIFSHLNPEYMLSAVHFTQITAERRQRVRWLLVRLLIHHNTPESVQASCDLASKTLNSKAASIRSDFLGVVSHGGAEQSFFLVRGGKPTA